MHIFIHYNLPKLRNYPPNVAIRNYIQTEAIFEIFQFPDFCVTDISKSIKVRNLKQRTLFTSDMNKLQTDQGSVADSTRGKNMKFISDFGKENYVFVD